ncbi:MAG TPA: DNA primase [Candidatus Acidoferrum sp.]|nr:DNA primase [Candidatus Acidoferrum sp.]
MAGLIPPHLLEQIRAANDIVDVIGSYLPLKRAGTNFRALCPFHREKTPSFNVNPHHQIFKCFGCGKGGDVFTFVKEYESIAFIDAVRRLAERAKIPLEFENNPAAQQARHIKDVLLQIHEQITTRWQSALANEAGGQIARDYLEKRGVSPDAVKLFRIGYAPEAWDDTVNWAKSKNHELATVAQAGLIIQKEGTDRYYDRFRGRLIFPICDEQGRVIGFSGRILTGDEKTAKYVNSPETPIFTKGKVFFGLDKSKRALLDSQTAIICEGQLDLITCFMTGVQNIVAPQGTALTPDHARILKRYVEEVVLCFDADNAGQNAAVRSLDALLAAGLAIRVASVPSGKDPDQFIKENGGEAFREIIEKAEGFFDYYIKRLCVVNDIASDKGRLTVIREFGEALLKTHSAVLIDTYAQKAALRLGVAPEAVRSEFRKSKSAPAPAHFDDEGPREGFDEQPIAPPSAHEMQLLKILLSHDDQVALAAKQLRPGWIVNPVVHRIVLRQLDQHGDDHPRTVAASFAEFVDDPAAQSLLSEILADSQPVPHPEKQIGDILKHLRDDALTRESDELRRQMANPETTDEQRIAMLHRQHVLRTEKQKALV